MIHRNSGTARSTPPRPRGSHSAIAGKAPRRLPLEPPRPHRSAHSRRRPRLDYRQSATALIRPLSNPLSDHKTTTPVQGCLAPPAFRTLKSPTGAGICGPFTPFPRRMARLHRTCKGDRNGHCNSPFFRDPPWQLDIQPCSGLPPRLPRCARRRASCGPRVPPLRAPRSGLAHRPAPLVGRISRRGRA